MTTGGWIVMTLSIGFVLALVGFCLTLVLKGDPPSRDD